MAAHYLTTTSGTSTYTGELISVNWINHHELSIYKCSFRYNTGKLNPNSFINTLNTDLLTDYSVAIATQQTLWIMVILALQFNKNNYCDESKHKRLRLILNELQHWIVIAYFYSAKSTNCAWCHRWVFLYSSTVALE